MPALDGSGQARHRFAEMMVGRHDERLDTWITAVEADNQSDLHRFVNGLRRDEAACATA